MPSLEISSIKRGKDQHPSLCAVENKYVSILEQAHTRQVGDHFSKDTIAKAIMMVGIWWPILFLDTEEYTK